MNKNKFQFCLVSAILFLSFCAVAVNYVSAEEESDSNLPTPTTELPTQTKMNASLKEKIKSGYQKIFFKTGVQNKKPAPALNATYKEAAEKKGLGQQERVQVQKKVLNTFAARVENYVKNVFQRFYALIKREDQIKGRIETRIIKLAEKGLDMTAATLAIESAGESLETIKGQVETMRNETEDALKSSATNARELFADFRQQTFLLKKEIRNIHIQLVQSVKAMREAVLKNKEDKEETPETEEQTD